MLYATYCYWKWIIGPGISIIRAYCELPEYIGINTGVLVVVFKGVTES